MNALGFFSDHLGDYLDELRRLVAIDTKTGDAVGCELAAGLLESWLDGLATISREPHAGFGPLLRARRSGAGCRAVVVAHYDTVWEAGSWPVAWRERDGRVYGPGVYDMKSGVLFALWLLRWLEASGREHPDLEILLTPDEEVGSPASRARIEQAAAAADFALVLEPATPEGDLKVARKGSGEYLVEVTGQPAHQGVAPQDGVNAVVEAAHQVLRMLELEDLAAGTTVGPNILSGGSASNIVAAGARIVVDVRAWTAAEMQRLDAALHSLQPVLPRALVTVSGRWNRPPMEPTAASIELFERARGLGTGLGLELERVAWGGSSDANLTAAAGVPTLDGLGPIGDHAHGRGEHVVVAELPRRMALLAELVASLTEPPERWLSAPAMSLLERRRAARSG